MAARLGKFKAKRHVHRQVDPDRLACGSPGWRAPGGCPV